LEPNEKDTAEAVPNSRFLAAARNDKNSKIEKVAQLCSARRVGDPHLRKHLIPHSVHESAKLPRTRQSHQAGSTVFIARERTS